MDEPSTAVRSAQPPATVGGTSAPTRPTTGSSASAARTGRPLAQGRRVKLTVSRIDPWSAMKMAFLLSVALGIAMVVMVAVLWSILSGMGVFDQVDQAVGQIVSGGSTESSFSIMDFVGFSRVISLSVVVAVIDVLIITAISTLAAFLYNVCSALVGGLQLTLTDD